MTGIGWTPPGSASGVQFVPPISLPPGEYLLGWFGALAGVYRPEPNADTYVLAEVYTRCEDGTYRIVVDGPPPAAGELTS